MSDVAIRAEHLSKQYRIGGPQGRFKYRTIRETLVDAAKTPLRRAARLLRGEAYGAADLDETIWALRDVSLEVKHGEAVGIIGRNGAGKTTLLKILSRITEPTEGGVDLYGRVGSLLEVGTGFHPELTGRENIYLNGAILGMRRTEIERKFDEIVAFSEIEKFLDTPVKHYSSGMYVRLAFSVAAHLEPEILLVDEVLAVGDAAFQKKCLGKMDSVAREGRTVLFVSHNLAAVEYLCSTGIVLENGTVAMVSSANSAVRYYESAVVVGRSTPSTCSPPHVIFQKPPDSPMSEFEIVRIELLDAADQPKPQTYTWDTVKFRLHYYANQAVNTGSLVLRISSRQGVTLLLLSTEPDSAVPMRLEAGYCYGDCQLEQLPLAAGDYIVGAGLAVPKKEWLYREDNLAVLTVQPRDVYRSGSAPVSSRSLLAVPHRWDVP